MTKTTLEKANECLIELATELHSLRKNFLKNTQDRLSYTEEAANAFLEHYQENYPTESAGLIHLKSPNTENTSYDKYVVFIGECEIPANQSSHSYEKLLKNFPDMIIFDPIMGIEKIEMEKNKLCAYFSRAIFSDLIRGEKDPSLSLPEGFTTSLSTNADISTLHPSSFFPTPLSGGSSPQHAKTPHTSEQLEIFGRAPIL